MLAFFIVYLGITGLVKFIDQSKANNLMYPNKILPFLTTEPQNFVVWLFCKYAPKCRIIFSAFYQRFHT